jgi:hypothetical protein
MIKIEFPVAWGNQAVMRCEIQDEYFGYMDNAAECLSTIVSTIYGYPVTVDVRTNEEFSIKVEQ